ncbi:helix-turn-helix domain-containing protein [Microbacterium sp.]|uniref:helix-turn-helix domain-containing protein n=1 Tax=Microbacterium sp. TaxID=51671 RepID=UPI003C75ECC5
MTTVVRLYSIPDTADLLAVSRATVYRLIRAGELRAVTRTIMRIRADDLQAHVDAMPTVRTAVQS